VVSRGTRWRELSNLCRESPCAGFGCCTPKHLYGRSQRATALSKTLGATVDSALALNELVEGFGRRLVCHRIPESTGLFGPGALVNLGGISGHFSVLDYQKGTTSTGTTVNHAAGVVFTPVERCQSGRASRRAAMFLKKCFKALPFSTFMPSVSQRPGPAALGLVVRPRGRVEDHSDQVSAVALARAQQRNQSGIGGWRAGGRVHGAAAGQVA
jgi:hypothetical protein